MIQIILIVIALLMGAQPVSGGTCHRHNTHIHCH